MSNQVGERYTCSNPSCGCEIEVLNPSAMLPSERPKTAARRPILSSELLTPPSQVNIPRQRPGIEEGAGEREGDYGSPKLEEPGAFRDDDTLEEEALEQGSPSTGRTSAAGYALGSLTCFCGSAMTLSDSRSTSARAGLSR